MRLFSFLLHSLGTNSDPGVTEAGDAAKVVTRVVTRPQKKVITSHEIEFFSFFTANEKVITKQKL